MDQSLFTYSSMRTHLILLLAVARAGFASPGILTPPTYNASNISGYTDPLLGSNLSPNLKIDIKIDITPRNWGEKLRPLACLVSGVELLGRIALEDSNGAFAQPQLYAAETYPEIRIGLIPVAGERMQRTLAFRGVVLSIFYMLTNKRFQTVGFDLELEGRLVGHVYFAHVPQAPSSNAVATPLPTTQTASALKDMSESNPVNVSSQLGEPTFNIYYAMNPGGREQPIPIFTVIKIIVLALADAAKYPSAEVINFDDRPVIGAGINAKIYWTLPTPRRKRPPFLQWQWVIKALVQGLLYMVRVSNFGEIVMILELGSSLIGTVYLVEANSPVEGVGADVSIS